mgnify:CR=1 FL=1
MAIGLSKELLGLSSHDLAKNFGNRDHSTVLHALNKVSKNLEENKSFHDTYKKLRKKITVG